MSESEVEELLKLYNVTKDKLPKIRKDDPAIQGLGAKVGDVIKITRKNPWTGGESLYYRVVIEAE